MCTLSICLDFGRNSALVTMNRDEARNRPSENEPAHYWGDDILGPQDSVGDGTWIAVNKDGYYAALLNAYGGADYIPEIPQSRGEIIPYILSQKNPRDALNDMNLKFYAGFKIVIGYRAEKPQLLSWDGQEITRQEFHGNNNGLQFFHTSSSVDQDRIIEKRTNQFNRWANSDQSLTQNNIPVFHESTQPDSSSAILMSRKKSVTKSITSISIGDQIEMRYFAVKSSKVSLIKSYSLHGKK